MDSDLVQDLKPDVLRPVRSDDGHEESLQLNVAEDHVPMHSQAGSRRGVTVLVTGARHIVQGRLQSELEVGAETRLANVQVDEGTRAYSL